MNKGSMIFGDKTMKSCGWKNECDFEEKEVFRYGGLEVIKEEGVRVFSNKLVEINNNFN